MSSNAKHHLAMERLQMHIKNDENHIKRTSFFPEVISYSANNLKIGYPI
jgi:hypothetical protein